MGGNEKKEIILEQVGDKGIYDEGGLYVRELSEPVNLHGMLLSVGDSICLTDITILTEQGFTVMVSRREWLPVGPLRDVGDENRQSK